MRAQPWSTAAQEAQTRTPREQPPCPRSRTSALKNSRACCRHHLAGHKDSMMTDEELIALAREAALEAYAPYSGFEVGCAIESIDGRIVTGANVENACYRLGICAEQHALANAQAKFGIHNVARIAVAGGHVLAGSLFGEQVVTPCGGCRQAILEAAQLGNAMDIEIVCASGDGKQVERHSISTLLPHSFGPANLRDANPA
ncbi:MAG TPA: cytidine deaminase [Sphingomicrobium sp.]|nr:cytidine deaminase [Sphingomicrobium sp.]